MPIAFCSYGPIEGKSSVSAGPGADCLFMPVIAQRGRSGYWGRRASNHAGVGGERCLNSSRGNDLRYHRLRRARRNGGNRTAAFHCLGPVQHAALAQLTVCSVLFTDESIQRATSGVYSGHEVTHFQFWRRHRRIRSWFRESPPGLPN